LCDIALREFLFWEATKVVLHANAKLLILCLAYCTCLACAIKGYSGLEKFRSQQVSFVRVFILGGGGRSARECGAADSMLGMPAWPVRFEVARDWKSFGHGG